MNICIISPHQLNPTTGGIDRVTVNLIKELLILGHNIYCLYKYDSVDKVYDIGKQYCMPNNCFSNEKSVLFARELIIKNNIDLILNQSFQDELNIFCSKIKKLTGVKIITTLHFDPLWQVKGIIDSIETIKYTEDRAIDKVCKKIYHKTKYPITKHLRFRMLKEQYRRIYDVSDKYVLLSDKFFTSFKRILSDKNLTKLEAISNPIPLNGNSNIDFRKKKKQIVYVGRVEFSEKRVDRLLHIWKRSQDILLDWNLVIIGEGSGLDRLKELAYSLKLKNISFEGRKDPSKFYSESRVFCMTSTHEGFGMVLPEAQSYGCVPVAFDSFESIHDIITDGQNGILIPPFNINLYSKRLVEICNDESKLEEMGRNGLNTVKKFEASAITKQWVTLFEQVLK